MKALAGCLGVLIAIPIATAYAVLAYGYVLTRLWEWFVIPVFAVEQLNILQAYGLILIANLMKTSRVLTAADQYANTQLDSTEKIVMSIMQISVFILVPWMSLLIGYIVTLFM